MNNLFMAFILLLVSYLAEFAGFHANNKSTKFLLNLASTIYLFASIWKFIVFGVWIVKYLF